MRKGAAWTREGGNVRRRIILILIFLLAGAVVNVAVAWMCALTSSAGTETFAAAVHDSTIWQVGRYSRTGAVVFVSVRDRSGGVGRSGFGGDPAEFLDDWTGFASPTPQFESGEITRETRVASGRGLPMLALWCETTRGGEGQIRGGIDTGALPLNFWIQKTPPFWADSRVLPLRPLWPGFAVNTLFYAALLWSPFVLRRFIRVRRGLCPACAYPRGESDVCSECGKALPNSRSIIV